MGKGGKGRGKGGKGTKGVLGEWTPTLKTIGKWRDWGMDKAKVAFHYGFIPLIIIVGMNSEPKPHLSQLLTPI